MQEQIQETSPANEQEEVSFFSTVDSGSFWDNHDEEATFGDSTGQPQQQAQVAETAEGVQQSQPEQQEAQQPQGDKQSPYPDQGIPEGMSPEDVYKMARYFQSEKDKTAQQAREYQKQIEALQAANPIGQYAATDPAFMAHIATYLNGSSSGSQPGSAAQAGGVAQEALPQKPVRPKRPANMDPYSDEAAEYQAKLDEYYEAKDAYTDAVLNATLEKEQKLSRAREMEQQQRAQLTQAYNTLRYEYGLNDQQASDYIQWAQSPETLNNTALWVNAYKMSKGIQPSQQQRTPLQTPNAGPMTRRVQQHTAAAVPAGAAPQQQDSFFQVQNRDNSIW